MISLVAALLLAQVVQTTALVGRTTPGAVTVQGAVGGVAVPVSGTVSITAADVNLIKINGATVLTGNGTAAGSLRVTLASDTSPLAVTGTFWQATQPVSGTVTANQGGTWNIGTVTTLTGITNTVTSQPAAVASANDAGSCVSVAASTTVLASFASRKFAGLVAKATNTDRVFFKLGATATTSNAPLEPGQTFTIDGGAIYTGVIDAIANSGTQSVCVVEF